MTEDNKNMNDEDLAKKLDAMDQGINTNTRDSVSNEADAMESAIDAQGLGRVDMNSFGPATPERSDNILGWHDVNLADLPSKGKFYPADLRMQIRSAKAAEIRHFSTMDEANYLDMEEKLNSIIESCCKLESGTRRLSYKDVLEEDRIILLLKVRDLTFPEPENKIILKGKMSESNKPVEIELSTRYMVSNEVPEEIEKYYSAQERTYVIKTRSAGTVKMHPPTIGVMQEITKYLKDRQEKGAEYDKAFIQVLPYLISDWRALNLKKIFELEIEYKGWDERKFMVVYRLAERMKIGIETTLEKEIDGEVAKAPLNFPGGIKSLFIISDLAGELL
jgi:hypothetical protein